MEDPGSTEMADDLSHTQHLRPHKTRRHFPV